jgi:hypothetical protein
VEKLLLGRIQQAMQLPDGRGTTHLSVPASSRRENQLPPDSL